MRPEAVGSSRAEVVNAAVASPHWAASAVGREVLLGGGNALDAAVAANALLAVAYPHMCGLGGDLFLLYYSAADGRLHCLNGSGPAPRLATREAFLQRGLDAVPARGPLSVTVPGAVAAWAEALGRFGSRELGQLLEPAIRATTEGVEVTARLSQWIAASATELRSDPRLCSWLLDRKGAPIPPGTRLRLPELAETLRQIASRGAEAFYRGRIADEIDRACREAGGLLRREDLEEYRPEWASPLDVGYRGLRVYTTPPNSQGIVTLEMLNILSSLDAHRFSPGSAEQIDALVRAKRAAFADRDRYVSDPAFVDVPIQRLLSREHARALAGRRPPRAAQAPIGGDTVYVCATDPDGNACSLIQSIYYGFGSAFVAGATGVLLQNRGHYFSLRHDHPNRLEPRKRTLHTLMASMALRNGRPWLVWGTMGADGQPQTTVQVLERILAGADPQAAVAAPRVLSGRFFIEDDEDRVLVEEDLGAETIAELGRMGHKVDVVPPWDERMGHAQAIVIGDDGLVRAGSDPRSDGLGPGR